MQEHSSGWWTLHWAGVFAGALMVGAALGLVVLVLGQLLNLRIYGRVGFLACVVASLVGGIILAAPTCIGFVVAIVLQSRRKKEVQSNESHRP
jgi:hypothetical protein